MMSLLGWREGEGQLRVAVRMFGSKKNSAYVTHGYQIPYSSSMSIGKRMEGK